MFVILKLYDSNDIFIYLLIYNMNYLIEENLLSSKCNYLAIYALKDLHIDMKNKFYFGLYVTYIVTEIKNTRSRSRHLLLRFGSRTRGKVDICCYVSGVRQGEKSGRCILSFYLFFRNIGIWIYIVKEGNLKLCV